jgi:hypothetical protein
LPHGADWSISRYDLVGLHWKKTDRRHVQNTRYGVFRFRISFQPDRYFVRWMEATYELPRAIAIYVLLHRKRRYVFRYNPVSHDLSLPANCRPPRVLERALVLCSGLPPASNIEIETRYLTYFDVPLETAQLAAQLLLQPLK